MAVRVVVAGMVSTVGVVAGGVTGVVEVETAPETMVTVCVALGPVRVEVWQSELVVVGQSVGHTSATRQQCTAAYLLSLIFFPFLSFVLFYFVQLFFDLHSASLRTTQSISLTFLMLVW